MYAWAWNAVPVSDLPVQRDRETQRDTETERDLAGQCSARGLTRSVWATEWRGSKCQCAVRTAVIADVVAEQRGVVLDLRHNDLPF